MSCCNGLSEEALNAVLECQPLIIDLDFARDMLGHEIRKLIEDHNKIYKDKLESIKLLYIDSPVSCGSEILINPKLKFKKRKQ